MTYHERRLARAQRLNEWADRRDEKANQAYLSAAEMVDGMPLGQPILVGHHSEGKMRRHHARIDANMRASIDHGQKAEEMRGKAENILSAAEKAIYSDDPDAVERLEKKLAGLEARRASIRAYNASCHRGEPDQSLLIAKDQDDLAFMGAQLGRNGAFPSYALGNLGASIGRLKKRLARLKAAAGAATQS